ncbi:MAG: excinuclease ABC subunit UvrA, partial [Patescibacteria group bacterium]|nr:excinuclease ABC subunit UvrA [Patescibacteria group bacterium]
MISKHIKIRGAKVHNLKDVDVDIPRDKLVVLTGISGSGKSSLAFDTIYAEGQRRYVESLSTYARQFLGLMDKPDVDSIEGLSPAISIDQRSASNNPRSTVGTITEIYDYLRLVFARTGHVHCHNCGQPVKKQSASEIMEEIFKVKANKTTFFAPLVFDQKGEHRGVLNEIKKSSYNKARIDGKFYGSVGEMPSELDNKKNHRIELYVGELNNLMDKNRIKDELIRLVELSLDLGNGQVIILTDAGKELYFSQYYHCPKCNLNLPSIEPRNFSFNSPAGACPKCLGLGTKLEVDPGLVIPNKKLTLAQGAIKPWARNFFNQNTYWQLLKEVAAENNFSLDTPVNELAPDKLKMIFYGTGEKI